MYLTQLIKVQLLRLYETLKKTQVTTGYCVTKEGKGYGIMDLLEGIEYIVLLKSQIYKE